MTQPLLKVDKIHTYYGDSHILQGVSLKVYPGEVVVLVGRHGVGKTTTLLSIMGIEPPKDGKILLKDREIFHLPSWDIAQRGIGLVPENRRIFSDLTVQENLEVAFKSQKTSISQQKKTEIKSRIHYNLESAYAHFPELVQFRHKLAQNLSGGQQQMLTIARTLMGNPQLILMDEPTEGLAPVLVQRTAEVIQRLSDRGETLLITGQNIAFALELADRVYILDMGTIQWSGTMAELRSRPEILDRYLALSVE